MNLEKICLEVCELARDNGKFAVKELSALKKSDIKTKSSHDFVTYVDKTIEENIIHNLKNILPGTGFLAEETASQLIQGGLNWIIDPLDGTTNYIHGLCPFAISIALVSPEETLAGVVYEAGAGECFYAWKNSPAFLNGSTVAVSSGKNFGDSLIATGFPYYDFTRIEPFMQALVYFFENTHGVRRLGSAATDLAYVACGRFEAFYEYSLSPWDVAAGAFIVERAGGKVSDFRGGGNYIFGKEIIATNHLLYNDFLKIIKKYFCK